MKVTVSVRLGDVSLKPRRRAIKPHLDQAVVSCESCRLGLVTVSSVRRRHLHLEFMGKQPAIKSGQHT